MADPISVFSIVSGSASLAMQCAQVAKALYDIAGKFKHAELTVMSAVQELDIIRLAWEKIEKILQDWDDGNESDADLLSRLHRQLDFGNMVMTALSKDLAAFEKRSYSLVQRSKVVWNEGLFKAHQHRIRGQVAAMNLLISVLSM